jgi:ATP-dependent DNA helicase RecG
MGDLMGARQSGDLALRHANLVSDGDLLEKARAMARDLIERDPALQRPEHAALRERAIARFPRAVELFRVG